MVITTINVERDVRRRYNRRVLFCIRIKGAALLIGLWDLVIHSAALCALILMFGRVPQTMIGSTATNSMSYRPASPLSANTVLNNNNNNFLSNDLLSNGKFERRNASHPSMDFAARTVNSRLDFMTVKWAQSLSQQDKCIVFFVVFSATILILAHISGVLTNKASYIVPYFLMKVFNVIVSILSMLGFYAYLPDITIWLRMQPNFPLKQYLLDLDAQTLQLVIFTFLLFIVLAKLYIAAIIWYCYGYVTALAMARTIGTITAHNDDPQYILREMYSPPKYEEAIKSNHHHLEEDHAPPPYTPLLSS